MSVLEWFGLGKKARVYLIIRGQVYEGAYTLYAERRARARGAKGWMKVTQQPMNSYIEMEADGQYADLEKLIMDLRKGPPLAQISKVEVEWRQFKGTYHDFRLRH